MERTILGSNPALTVRAATDADAEAVAAIYNEGIRGRMATYETAERTGADVRAWLGGRHPFLVAERERDGAPPEVVGWVRASNYRPRACYGGVGEFSVYVASSARGQRVGDALMHAFIPACERAGLWKVLSRIFPENAASRRLCVRHGFREVGIYEKHARLDGVWRDVVIVERLIPGNLR
jgi:phosphinothricin acetyltransferase